MKFVSLSGRRSVPALGLGTWRYGESRQSRSREIAAIELALAIGYRLIDTAEMYGSGGAEEVIGAGLGRALDQRIVSRDDVFIVSKVYPHNATRNGVTEACARTLDRLRVDYLDLYLLHWRGRTPLAATVEGFERLQADNRIRQWGVSNFDVDDMEDLWRVPVGSACVANQVYYSVSERGLEYDLLPWQRQRQVPLMAYCPIDRGSAANNGVLAGIGAVRGATAAQVALAWILRHPDVIAIPKAVGEDHLRENLAAADIDLATDELAAIDKAFPPPARKVPLTMY
jgi:diketogulonate reductase-like aldo/keto reductase